MVEAVVDKLSAPAFLEHVGVVAGRLERGLDDLYQVPGGPIRAARDRSDAGTRQPDDLDLSVVMASTISHGVLAIRPTIGQRRS